MFYCSHLFIISPNIWSGTRKVADSLHLFPSYVQQDEELIPIFDKDKVHGSSELSCGADEGTKIYDAQLALLVDRFHVPKNIKRVRSERKPKSVIAVFMKRCKKTAETLSPNVLEVLELLIMNNFCSDIGSTYSAAYDGICFI